MIAGPTLERRGMTYFDAGENVLPDLVQLKNECEKAVDLLKEKDYELSDNFLNLYKKYYPGKIEYVGPHYITQYPADNLEVLASFQFFRASLAVPFLKGLKRHRTFFLELNKSNALQKIFDLENIRDGLSIVADLLRGAEIKKEPYKGRELQDQERIKVKAAAQQTLSHFAANESDMQSSLNRFMDFITNYKSWGGGKSICREDYYISATTNALKLVNASNGAVANAALLMSTHDDLYNEITRIMSEQSADDKNVVISMPKEIGNNLIIYGAPGTGKSHTLEMRVPEKYKTHIRRVVFHSEYSYFDFVGSYKPTPIYRCNGNNNGSDRYFDAAGEETNLRGTPVIDYQFVPGPFIESLVEACNHPQQPYYLLIEEINRANAAAVFGDIFQLLDRDEYGNSKYGIAPSKELRDYLSQHLTNPFNGELRIPGNLFIWATMNNADQGVMFMDSAFKRRWNFEYETISLSLNEKLKTSQLTYNNRTWTLFQILSAVNEKLRKITPPIPEDRLIGQFFLPEESLNSETNIKDAFKKVLIYLWDDVLRNNNREDFFGSSVDSLSYLFDKYQIEDVLGIDNFLEMLSITAESQPDSLDESNTDELDENDGRNE